MGGAEIDGGDLAGRLLERITRDGWLPDGATLVLAVSGGADSMALWDLLAAARRWRLAIYHLDHGLRDDAALDAALIRAQAEAYAARGLAPIEVTVERTDIAALARRWHCSVELAGRRHRYARLRAMGARLAAAAVLTAHHRDDQVETVLANLLRGAGPVGRAGIAPRRPLAPGLALVRPLLPYARAELRAHCQARHIAWREDSTNQDTALQRNFLRHEVLPLLEAGVPGLADELAGLAAASQAELAESEQTVEDAWRRALGAEDLLIDHLQALAPRVRHQVWRRLLVHLVLPIERRHLDGLDALARGAVGRRLTLGRWLLLRRAHAIAWESQYPQSSSELVPIGGEGVYLRGGERLTCSIAAPPQRFTGDATVAWLAQEACSWPLEWRPSRPGERWLPLGSPGRQTVVKFLSARGVSSRLRPLTPVIADRYGVLWVPGFGIAERARVPPDATAVVCLVWEPACQAAADDTVSPSPEDADEP